MGKRTTNQMHTLDIRRLNSRLTPGASLGWQWSSHSQASLNLKVSTDSVTLTYRRREADGNWKSVEYPIRLTRTPCNFGGSRTWWLCPHCGRRVAVLYGGCIYACRNCYDLTYKSTRTASNSKHFARANKVRERLGWGGCVASPMGDRKRGMHKTTYLRLLTQLTAYSIAAFQSTEKQTEKITSMLGKLRQCGPA